MKLGLVKFGHIGCSLLDKLLDERAEREDLEVFSIGSGSKMDIDSIKDVVGVLDGVDVDAYVIVSPNPSVSSVVRGVEELNSGEEPVLVVGDCFGKEAKDRFRESGIGYVFVFGDALIGARKEFLDPAEMAGFNADVLKVLSNTGVFRFVLEEVDDFLDAIKSGSSYLPEKIVDPSEVVDDEFSNPYARAKARASLEIAQQVAEKNKVACYGLDERSDYLPLVAATHEMMRKAADLADEAREIEKSNDTVLRRPHDSDGCLLSKRGLEEEFKK